MLDQRLVFVEPYIKLNMWIIYVVFFYFLKDENYDRN